MECIRKASFGNRIYSSFVFKLGKDDFIYTISINAIAYILFMEKSHFERKKLIYDFENRMIVYSPARFEIPPQYTFLESLDSSATYALIKL